MLPGEERFTVEGKIESIISIKQFDKVQALLVNRSPSKASPRRINSEYLLSGLLYCAKCGNAMQGGSAKSGQYQYYGCYNHLRKGKMVCDAKSINRVRMEKTIVDKLKQRVLTPQRLTELLELTNREIKRQFSLQSEKVTTHQRMVDSKQAKLDRLFDALESGKLSAEDLGPRIKKLKDEISTLTTKVEAAKLQADSDATVCQLTKTELNRYVDDLYDLLNEGSIFERRGFFRSFVKRIDFEYPEVKVEYTLPLIKKPPYKTEVLSFVKNGGLYETSFATGW